MGREWTQTATFILQHNDEEYELDLVGHFSMWKDGEDADENRGWWVTSCDDIDILSIDPPPKSKEERTAIEECFYNNYDADDVDWDDGDR